MTEPHTQPAVRSPPESAACDLCGADCASDDFCDAAGLYICPLCIEAELDASTDFTRTALGLVGGGH
jgi:hypothetical protein